MGNEQSSPQDPEERQAETNAAIDKFKEDTLRELDVVEAGADNPTRIPLHPKSSSHSSPQDDDVLQSFGPRKQPLNKSHKSQSALKGNTDSAALQGTSTSSKRPATELGLESDQDVLSLPKVARTQYLEGIQGEQRATATATASDQQPTKWYTDLGFKNSRAKGTSEVDALLMGLRTQIQKCQTSARNGIVKVDDLERVRFRIHKLMFTEVNEVPLKSNRMLHNEDGLPQLFHENFTKGVKYPFDIKADALELYTKWCRRVFDADLYRGIIFNMRSAAQKSGTKSGGDSIDPDYQGVVSSKFHGNGDLINGQWWPTLLCALRDGAHGATVAGISGKSGEGAYSVFMSSGSHNYDDKDEGNVVYYCGTDSTDGSITEPTRQLLESYENGRPVRLLRSSKLNSQYAPNIGFRYDGLYEVVNYENRDGSNSRRQRHRFKLKRKAGQDPIRGGNGPEKRPTEEEEAQYRKHRAFTGKSSV